MKKAIRNYSRPFAAIIGLVIASLVVGLFISQKERLNFPSFVPLLGKDLVKRKLEVTTGKALTPGQGQTVEIAGVQVGQISKVELVDGRALVTVSMMRPYSDRVMRDASALVRPKTGLEDQTIQLDPGHPAAGPAPVDYVIPINQTLPTVETDQILSELDADTRDYLRMLLAGAGQGLQGNDRNLSNTFRRFEPTGRELLRISGALAVRRENIRRAIHNFRLVTEAIGTKDQQLSQLVDSSNAVFQSFANQDRNLRQTLRLLPGTLDTTRVNLAKVDTLARTLGPSSRQLLPLARALPPALRDTRPFLRETAPIIRDQIRPFTRAALPTVRPLRGAARDLASLTPDLTASLGVVNELVNELAYDPPGGQGGFLFWLSWANHDGNSVFSTQDAHGPIRRILTIFNCSSFSNLGNNSPSPQTAFLFGSLFGDIRQAAGACPGSTKGAGGGEGSRGSSSGSKSGTSTKSGGGKK